MPCVKWFCLFSKHPMVPRFCFAAILSAEKKITFRSDLGLLTTENFRRIVEDFFRREYKACLLETNCI